MKYKKNKYKNKKCTVLGILFHSRKEANFYLILRDRLLKKEIKDLELQPKFILQENFKYNGKTERKITYVADFQYFDIKENKIIIVDVKGIKTDVYKLKRKLLLFKYPDINFIEL